MNAKLDQPDLATRTAIQSAPIADQDLDYLIYLHACKITQQTPDHAHFIKTHQQGQLNFSTNKHLLADLLELYQINLQRLAGEWLASTDSASSYGPQPLTAALKLIAKLHPADAAPTY